MTKDAAPFTVQPLQRILYTVEEAAELLSCSRRHLDRRHSEGLISYTRDGSSVRVHRDELESYARSLTTD